MKTVVGIGGRGQNFINYVANNNIDNIQCISLQRNLKPDNSFYKSYKIDDDKLFLNLEGQVSKTQEIYLVSGLGQKTGSIYTPIVASYLQKFLKPFELLITIPFKFEAKNKIAQKTLRDLKSAQYKLHLYENDDLLRLMRNKKMSSQELFLEADKELMEYIQRN